jgi:glycine/D-amino acid oxidase-like deaminating enzyme
VEVMRGVEARRVEAVANCLRVVTVAGATYDARLVFNCTYAQLNALVEASGLPLLPLKHEITEIALIEPAPALQNLGVTVMDGPFFSTMPFPAAKLYSFTHVRYTPHEACREGGASGSPWAYLQTLPLVSNYALMVKDASRYLPAVRAGRYVRSLYTVKTVLTANEGNDGRPILYRCDYGLPGFSVILGGKIDNVYDILAAVRTSLEADPQWQAPCRTWSFQDFVARRLAA